jgi:uncharacterized protein (TIGR02679 family)
LTVSSSSERLQRLLGGTELAALRARLRARFERGETRDVFTLTALNALERRALEGLLGRAVKSAGSMRLSHAELDETLSRGGLAADLHAALEAIDGPLTNLKHERLQREAAWQSLPERVDEPRLRTLASDPAGSSLLKRFAAGDANQALILLEHAARVLARLPGTGIPRARLAAEALGDSHALDAGRPVATLVLRACGLSIDSDPAERAREQWARLGVTVNELARPALCLNLPALGDGATALLVRAARAAGEPVHLTLRTLLRSRCEWSVRERDVFVCENAEIVTMAADRWGCGCASLVCTDGMPAAAQRTLLHQLVAAGATLRYHGDFDWEGIRIANFVMRTFGARPWRYGANDYLVACGSGGSRLRPRERIVPSWDDALGSEMSARGVLIHEEGVAEGLLQDLARSMPSRS